MSSRKNCGKSHEDELQLLDSIVNSIKQAVVVFDVALDIVYWNQAAELLHTVPSNQCLTNDMFKEYETYLADGITAFPIRQLPLFNTAANEHPAAAIELYVKRPDGTGTSVSVTGRPLFNRKGKSLGWLLEFAEISHQPPLVNPLSPRTEQVENPKLIDEQLMLGFDMLPIAIFVKDARSHFLIINKACEELWGYSQSDLLGTDGSQYFPAEQMQLFLNKDREVWENKSQIVIEELVWNDKLKENRLCLTFKKPCYDSAGNPLYLIATTKDITERRQIEQSLRETLASLRAIYDNLPFLAWMKDKEGRYLQANKHWLQAVGLTDQQRLNDITDFDIWPHKLAEHYRAVDQDVMHNLQPISLTEKALDEGRETWTETIKAPVIDDNGQVIGTTGLARDITQSRSFEEQLRNYSERLRLASKAAAIGVCEWDINFELADWDERNYEIFGIPQGTPIDYPVWATLVLPEDLPGASTQLRTLMRDKQEVHCEFRIRRQNDGVLRYIQASAIAACNERGELQKIVGVNIDITDLKQIEMALRESEVHLAHAQAQAHLGSWSLDIITNHLKWSDECYRVFGIALGTALTYEHFLACVHPEDRSFVDKAWQAAMQGTTYDIQHRIVVDGKIKWLRERADLEFAADGTLMRGVGTSQDITELKEIEKTLESSRLQLRQLAARREKAREEERKRIAREVHDELGQMLTALRMEISLLRIQFAGNNPPFSEKIHHIMGLLDQTIQVTREVATSLRPSAIEMGIVPALEWLTKKFSEQSGIECDLFYPEDYFEMDEDCSIVFFRITQESLTNVLRHAEADQVKISIKVDTAHYCLEIQDNGCGFDTKATKKSKSFGLLGIQERSLMLGGETNITSTHGSGTLVQVRIPANSIRHAL